MRLTASSAAFLFLFYYFFFLLGSLVLFPLRHWGRLFAHFSHNRQGQARPSNFILALSLSHSLSHSPLARRLSFALRVVSLSRISYSLHSASPHLLEPSDTPFSYLTVNSPSRLHTFNPTHPSIHSFILPSTHPSILRYIPRLCRRRLPSPMPTPLRCT